MPLFGPFARGIFADPDLYRDFFGDRDLPLRDPRQALYVRRGDFSYAAAPIGDAAPAPSDAPAPAPGAAPAPPLFNPAAAPFTFPALGPQTARRT